MTLIYRPFGLLLGIVAGLIGKRVFALVWSVVDAEQPPKPNTQDTSWGKVLVAAVLRGAIFRTTRDVVDRWGALRWYRLTGSWPGPKRPRSAPGDEAAA